MQTAGPLAVHVIYCGFRQLRLLWTSLRFVVSRLFLRQIRHVQIWRAVALDRACSLSHFLETAVVTVSISRSRSSDLWHFQVRAPVAFAVVPVRRFVVIERQVDEV